MAVLGPRPRSGIFLESSSDEHLGVLPGEDRLVREVMSRVVVTVDGSASVKNAAEIMRDYAVPTLAVCRENEVIGVLTEHDLAVNAVTHAGPSASLTVRDIMKKGEPLTCREDAILGDATRAMADHQLQSIPVVDAAGRLVGILSMIDAAAAVMPDVAPEWLAKMRTSTGSPGREQDHRKRTKDDEQSHENEKEEI